MTWVRSFEAIRPADRSHVGGKCYALARLRGSGFSVPDGICICAEAYRRFVDETGLAAKIHFEINRKSFEAMRWEEIWDASLRIRSMFVAASVPPDLRAEIGDAVTGYLGEGPVAVRSSALAEDTAGISFAGLHESYINIVGTPAVLDHVKLVWASLWSDRALLYRQELGLDVTASAMAVVVQKLLAGEASGVVFSRSPNNPGQAVIEAVYGLNQALVDGEVEPDRWIVERRSRKVVSHSAAERLRHMVSTPAGVAMVDLPADARRRPPLGAGDVEAVLDVALRAEDRFGAPQDVEWTISGGHIYVLQSRPITTLASESHDDRSWYLSLTRSFENLKGLRTKIEDQVLPGMDAEATRLAQVELGEISDAELAGELNRRSAIQAKWAKVYRDECIPFAHGMRLFGQIYNDIIRPQDAYEFMTLLSSQSTLSLERNRLLEQMAAQVRAEPDLARVLEAGGPSGAYEGFNVMLDDFLARFGLLSSIALEKTRDMNLRKQTMGLVLELASGEAVGPRPSAPDRAALEEAYIAAFDASRRSMAANLLDLARASYRLRDDDNIYLSRIEAELDRALEAARSRLASRLDEDLALAGGPEISKALRQPGYVPVVVAPKPASVPESRAAGRDLNLKARQLTGQPAGPGIGTGRARIVVDQASLFAFKKGEVLVCDAIEPEMTFVVPLAAGIVERRGGMLIHGAIIAREYGIPCVTGVPDAAELIAPGDTVTVDGYLGIVIVG